MSVSFLLVTEAVAQMCSVKKVFLEISQNSQENTCARASFFIKLRNLEIRTHPNSTFNIPNSLALTFTRLPAGLRHLRDYIFGHKFRNLLSLIYDCVEATKITKRCLLHGSDSYMKGSPSRKILQKLTQISDIWTTVH